MAMDFESFFSSIRFCNVHEDDVKHGQVYDLPLHDVQQGHANGSKSTLPEEKSPQECSEKVIHEVVSLNTIPQSITNDSRDTNLPDILTPNRDLTRHEIMKDEESVEVHFDLCKISETIYDKNTMTTAQELAKPHKEQTRCPRRAEEEEEEENNNVKEEEEEEDEFSRMSNEEINMLFEEFIHRCNQQIRQPKTCMPRIVSF